MSMSVVIVVFVDPTGTLSKEGRGLSVKTTSLPQRAGPPFPPPVYMGDRS